MLAGMLVIAGFCRLQVSVQQVEFLVMSKFFRSRFFLVEVVTNLSLHSKQLELGQDVLRYSIAILIELLS